MSQFEKSEVMIKYAELMQVATVRTTTGDVASAIATEVGVATLATAIGGPIATWLGIGAMLTPVGLIASVAITSYVIYSMRDADSTIDGLLGRLNDLSFEDGSEAEKTITEWKQILQKHKQLVQAKPPITDDSKVLGEYNNNQHKVISALVQYLGIMSNTFPQLKQHLTDWFGGWGDIGQFETALKETAEAMRQRVQGLEGSMLQGAKQNIATMVEKAYEKTVPMAQVMGSQIEQLTQIYGRSPQPETQSEIDGFEFLEKIQNKSLTTEDLSNIPGFVILSEVLKKAVAIKKASGVRLISKRALLLGDGTSVSMGPGVGTATKAPGFQRWPKDKNVEVMQGVLNSLHAKYETGASTIATDGRYGPKTAESFSVLLSKVPQLIDQLKSAGITTNDIVDHKSMRNQSANLDTMKTLLSNHARGQTPVQKVVHTTPDKEKEFAKGCPENKENMSDPEINRCLLHLRIEDPVSGQSVPAYNWINKYYDGKPSEVVHKVMGPTGFLPVFTEWSSGDLVEHVLTQMRSKLPKSERHKVPRRLSKRSPPTREVGPITQRLVRLEGVDKKNRGTALNSSLNLEFNAPSTKEPITLRKWLKRRGFISSRSQAQTLVDAMNDGAVDIAGVVKYVDRVRSS